MRYTPIAAALLLASCAEPYDPAPARPERSACAIEPFEGSRFTVCDPGSDRIELSLDTRRFHSLPGGGSTIRFAMNGGMFGQDHRPIGLTIVDGKEVKAINRRKGFGNFHLLPNGVFLVRGDGTSEVVSAENYHSSEGVALATQSGPMLLIDGELHPKIDPDGASHYIRNAVGIAPDGRARFVISDDAVSFGRIARFMRDKLKMKNALYLDGSVSSLWDPAGNRMDDFTDLGPILVVRKGAASAQNP